MHESPSSVTKSLGSILAGLICLLPIFIYLPTADIFEIPKWTFLGIIAAISLIFWIINIIKTKEAVIAKTGFFISLLPLLIILGANTLFVSKNKMEALIDPSGISTLVFLIIILIFGGSLISKETRKTMRWAITILSGILGIQEIYQALGIPKLIFPADSQFADPLFTPIGNPLILTAFLLAGIPSTGAIIRESIQKSREAHFAVAALCAIFSVIGAVAAIWVWWNMPTGGMPLSLGWSVMLESWKSLPQALFGFGIERFLAEFMALRPESTNQTPFWSMVYTKNASIPLHYGSVAGMAGIIGLAWLALSSVLTHIRSRYTQNVESSAGISLVLFYILLLFIPPHISLWITLLILFFTAERPDNWKVIVKAPGFFVLAIPSLAIAILIIWSVTRVITGETYASTGVRLSEKGDTAGAYKNTASSIAILPFVHQYRINMSQLSVGAAQNFYTAIQANVKDQTIAQEDLETISNLSDQAVREGKKAIELSPDDAVAWANLARLYTNLIGVAQNADQYAVASFRQAIALDPINPVLHMDLGALIASTEQYEEAINELKISISLKPDYANAYYNLANIYRIKGDYNNAKDMIKQTKQFSANDTESENLLLQLEEAINAMKPEELP